MKFTLEFTVLNKFVQHLAYDLIAYGQVEPYQPGTLFDSYHSDTEEEKDNHKFLFCASSINSETGGFILDSSQPHNIFLYFDKMNKSLYNDSINKGIKCLVKNSDCNQIKNIKNNTIKLDHYYSEYLMNLVDKNKKIPDINIITELSGFDKIPEILFDVLYPNTNLNIKMFNGLYVDHIQNLGFIEDITFLELINNSKLFIGLNNIFLPYALIMNKKVLVLENNNWIKKSSLIFENLNNPESLPDPSVSIKDIKNNSYSNFIKKYLL